MSTAARAVKKLLKGNCFLGGEVQAVESTTCPAGRAKNSHPLFG
jgi:hypothetical protein